MPILFPEQIKEPMSAARKFEERHLRLPVYVQPKYDGFRCLTKDGCALSRTFKPLPNRYIQSFFRHNYDVLKGFDGEIFIGDPKDRDLFNNSQGPIMSEAGEPPFTYMVFDYWNRLDEFRLRLQAIEVQAQVPGVLALSAHVRFAPTVLVNSLKSLMDFEASQVELGYEGVIGRDPHGFYKQGRSTMKGGECFKIKRFDNHEAKIVGFTELYSNQNEQVLSETGHQKRSAHQANMIPMNTLGALVCEWKDGDTFKLGSGFDMATRQEIWDNRPKYLGQYAKYKDFQSGGYEKPRHGIYLGIRPLIDVK